MGVSAHVSRANGPEHGVSHVAILTYIQQFQCLMLPLLHHPPFPCQPRCCTKRIIHVPRRLMRRIGAPVARSTYDSDSSILIRRRLKEPDTETHTHTHTHTRKTHNTYATHTHNSHTTHTTHTKHTTCPPPPPPPCFSSHSRLALPRY